MIRISRADACYSPTELGRIATRLVAAVQLGHAITPYAVGFMSIVKRRGFSIAA